MNIKPLILFCFIISLCLCSCNLLNDQRNHDLKLFKEYSKLSDGFKINYYLFYSNQTYIRAMITNRDYADLQKRFTFLPFKEFYNSKYKSNKGKAHTRFELYDIGKDAEDSLYYFDDKIGNYYAYYILIISKKKNELMFCLEYGD